MKNRVNVKFYSVTSMLRLLRMNELDVTKMLN